MLGFQVEMVQFLGKTCPTNNWTTWGPDTYIRHQKVFHFENNRNDNKGNESRMRIK